MPALKNLTDSNPLRVAKGVASQASSALGQQAAPPKAPTAGAEKSNSEEPELALEPDLPSDGRDLVGEAMIRDLPPQAEPKALSSPTEPSRQPH